ncbi:response regulator [Nocardioides sp. MAH-18]|uniref:Circadian input-output histidine kinase CikA n=1 Tax=Nocardioides agri TaxID=2682843 RepID=A0A6L6XSQ0_9ACTN|nr:MULTISPECIES: response regulator [unclassified Nocardioides]MBA2954640.1 response regulator [Nocardioides sp. CGMCC 1.13656]MVQ49496.1 response regulator [Nocardioides sp. MAH-18]
MDDPGFIRRLFDAHPDGLWVFDDDGVTVWANDHMARMLGRDPASMPGLPVHETMDEQGRRDFSAALARMVESGTGGQNIDSHFVRPDGTAVWGLVSFAPVVDDDGRRIGWLHRVTPYTDRKQLLETINKREQQLATAQQIAHLGSWEWDVRHDRVEWSDEMCRIFGVQQATEIDYLTYLERIHVDDRDLALAALDQGLHGTAFDFDHRIMRPDGEVRWIRGRGIPDVDETGTVWRLSGTAQDTTAVHDADEQAAEATRRLQLLQQMAEVANRATSLRELLFIAGAGVPMNTSWSAVAAYLYGSPAEPPELLDIGRDQSPVPPDAELAERARATGEMAVRAAPGLEETHSIVAMPVFLADEVVCVVELLADEVPPDENSHRLLSQIAHQLGVVAERERSASELAEARDAAMEASRLKSEFLATMSHEIRTPMNGVIGLTDLLLRTDLDEHQRRLAENLQGSGMTLLGIINDILDLSKIESGKLELEAADFDVRGVFDQVASLLSGPAHEKGLELVVACDPDVPAQLRGDSVRLGQVVSNLGANAVKFTDAGEVVIAARIERASSRDVVLRVDVTDTGVGIDPAERERLFEAFTQADPSTTRRHGGTGLGLTISRQLVEALGGEIWVVSEPGSGSTFSFTARLGLVSGSAARRLDVPVQLRGRHVLVVDDNATNRLILEHQLAAWHMRPLAVDSAEAALAALQDARWGRDPFEVVLLDLRMPDTDGLELARQIGALEGLPQPAMLLLTSEPVSRQQVVDAGIRGSLDKPIRHAELHETLLALLAPRPGTTTSAPARRRPALGVRVLVVEDNPVNQLVAAGFLEDLGCAVDLAGDGLEAVALLSGRHSYDVVLMDCRMPRLDGFDATRRIRKQEPPGVRVPIIAMTASALEGVRERCLEAGMDDYLTKPVDGTEVERALRTWAGSTAGGATEAEAIIGVLDPERVRMLEGLVKDGTTFFERTANSFISRVGEQVVAIRDAAESRNANDLLTTAHQLKGSALNLGLPRVAAAAERLESLGAAGRTGDTKALLDDLAAEVEIAVSALVRATGSDR